MVLQDTLRLLLVTALIDGVLGGIKSWNDLRRPRVPPDPARLGQRLTMKKEILLVPVLRRLDYKHRLTEKSPTVMAVDM